MKNFDTILNFWFAGLTDEMVINKNKPPANRWFTKNADFDQEIRQKFEPDLIEAAQGGHDSWAHSQPGRLALILLFDQFSRNIYRNTPKMFETDSLALKWTLHSLQDNREESLALIERVFLYMPLMHSERLGMQRMSVEYFERLVQESRTKNPVNSPYFEYNLTYAKMHLEIIEKFGRFPHRNTILGRTSTPEELEFLKQRGGF